MEFVAILILWFVFYTCTGWTKNWHIFVWLKLHKILTKFKLFLLSGSGLEKICNNTITKDLTTPQMCRYIGLGLPCEMSMS